MYIYIYIYVYTYYCIYIYIYMYTYNLSTRGLSTRIQQAPPGTGTVHLECSAT